jgi:ribosome-associated translation inhibitor RaiA
VAEEGDKVSIISMIKEYWKEKMHKVEKWITKGKENKEEGEVELEEKGKKNSKDKRKKLISTKTMYDIKIKGNALGFISE